MAKNITAFSIRTEISADVSKQTVEFKKAETNVEKYGQTVNKVAKDTSKAFDGAAVGRKWGTDLGGGLVQSLTGSINNIGQTVGTLIGSALAPGLGTAIGSTLGSGVDTLVGKASGPIMSLVKDGLAMNEQIERAQLHFKTFIGNEVQAAEHMKFLKAQAREAFDLQTFIDASIRLEDFTDDIRLVQSTLKAASDAAAAHGGSIDVFNKVVDSLGLMAETGKLTEKQMKSLAKSGIDATGYLAEAFGKSRKQIQQLMEAGRIRGEIAAGLIAAGIERDKGGYAAKVSAETSFGQRGTAEETLKQLSAQATTPFVRGQLDAYRAFNSLLNSPQATKIVDFLAKMLDYTVTLTESAVKKAVSVGGGIVEGIVGFDPAAMTGSFSKLADFMETGLKSVFKIESPSKWAIEKIGIPIGEGIAQGIGIGFLKGSDLERSFQRILTNEELQKLVRAAVAKYDIAPELVSAVIAQESRGRATAVSPKGAKGLMQFMPGTAAQYGIRGREFEPAANVEAGAHLLSDLMKQFGGDVAQALAHYNWSGRGLMPAETKNYVASIMGLLNSSSTVGRPLGVGAGIYGDVPVNQMSTVSLSGEQAKHLDELNAILKQYRELLEQLNTRIVAAESKAAAGDTRAGIELTSSGGLRDMRATYEAKIAAYEKEIDSYVIGIRSERAADEALKATAPKLMPELPKAITNLEDGFVVITDDIRQLNYQTRAADPELAALQQRLALFGVGLPPVMKGVNDAEKQVGDQSINLTQVLHTLEDQTGKTGIAVEGAVTKIAGAMGQVSGMIPTQTVGKKRGLFSKILGIAAPFLSLIPGLGTVAGIAINSLLGAGASIAGNVVGGNYGAAVSGIATGLQPGGAFRSTHSGASGSGSGSSGHGRAAGGPVRFGNAYRVGEQGEEWFIPEQNGYIYPHGTRFNRATPATDHSAVLQQVAAALDRQTAALSRLEAVPAGHIVRQGIEQERGIVGRSLIKDMSYNASVTDKIARNLRLP